MIKEIKKEDRRLSEIEIILTKTFFHVYLPLLLFWKQIYNNPCFYICFHRLSYCILRFGTTIQAQRNRSELFKIISVNILK